MEILSLIQEYYDYVDGKKSGLNEFQWQLLQTWYIKRHKLVGVCVPPVIRKFQQWLSKKTGPQVYETFSGDDCLRLNGHRRVRASIDEDRAKGQLVPKYHLGDYCLALSLTP